MLASPVCWLLLRRSHTFLTSPFFSFFHHTSVVRYIPYLPQVYVVACPFFRIPKTFPDRSTAVQHLVYPHHGFC